MLCDFTHIIAEMLCYYYMLENSLSQMYNGLSLLKKKLLLCYSAISTSQSTINYFGGKIYMLIKIASLTLKIW